MSVNHHAAVNDADVDSINIAQEVANIFGDLGQVTAFDVQTYFVELIALAVGNKQRGHPFVTGPVWAQAPASEKDQILSLFVGVPYTHKLGSLPQGYKLDGDYAKVTKVTGDASKSEIRFRPSNEGKTCCS